MYLEVTVVQLILTVPKEHLKDGINSQLLLHYLYYYYFYQEDN